MSNHYHLLISTPDANVSRVMRHINGVYTQKINKKYGLEGSLFKGRYKSILIDMKSYFKECVRYIHRNPIKAGLEQSLGLYKWTSHKFYADKIKRPDWLCINEALLNFGKYEKIAKKEYNDYVRLKISEDFERRLAGSNWPAVLGGDEFKNKIKQLILGKNLSEISSQEVKAGLPAGTIEGTLNMFLKYFNMTIQEYRGRQKEYYKVRDFAIRYCREKLNYKNVDLAKEFNVSSGTISRSYSLIKGDKEYDKILKGCEMLQLKT